MDWVNGFKRLNAVGGGVFACLIAGAALADGLQGMIAVGVMLGGVLGGFALYKLLCWLIDGFSSS